jgi:hypothetical protein
MKLYNPLLSSVAEAWLWLTMTNLRIRKGLDTWTSDSSIAESYVYR